MAFAFYDSNRFTLSSSLDAAGLSDFFGYLAELFVRGLTGDSLVGLLSFFSGLQ